MLKYSWFSRSAEVYQELYLCKDITFVDLNVIFMSS